MDRIYCKSARVISRFYGWLASPVTVRIRCSIGRGCLFSGCSDDLCTFFGGRRISLLLACQSVLTFLDCNCPRLSTNLQHSTLNPQAIPGRTNMRRFWDKIAHPDDPVELGGWSMGSEVMTAWNYTLTQYEDYKGQVDDLRFWGRAPLAAEIIAWSRGDRHSAYLLLADFAFDEGGGAKIRDRIDPDYFLTLFRGTAANWTPTGAADR